MTASVLVRHLYRSLLRASKPFVHGTAKYSPKTLTCFLHRSGVKMEEDEYNDSDSDHDEPSRSFQMQAPPSGEERGDIPKYTVESCYRKLLRDVVAGCSSTGTTLLQVPDRTNPQQLRMVIRREFRVPVDDEREFEIRRDVGFMALKQLNKKLAYVASIEEKVEDGTTRNHSTEDPVHRFPSKDIKSARRVAKSYPAERPDFTPPSTYLKPGTFLLAHPLLTGFFHRAVIVILDQAAGHQDQLSTALGTYGVIVNKPCDSTRITMKDVFKNIPLPPELEDIEAKVGGPVNISVQMLHMGPSSMEFGGIMVPELSDHSQNSTTAAESNESVFARGNIDEVAAAVGKGDLDPHTNVAFFVGGSSWSEGQLEKEIDLGFWIPCTGPVSLALFTPEFDQESSIIRDDTPFRHTGEDLWLSMMMACGEEEAELAKLLYGKDLHHTNIDACDELA